jgi:hypothetical protein
MVWRGGNLTTLVPIEREAEEGTAIKPILANVNGNSEEIAPCAYLLGTVS